MKDRYLGTFSGIVGQYLKLGIKHQNQPQENSKDAKDKSKDEKDKKKEEAREQLYLGGYVGPFEFDQLKEIVDEVAEKKTSKVEGNKISFPGVTMCQQTLSGAKKVFKRDEKTDPLQSKQIGIKQCIFLIDDAKHFKFEKEMFMYKGLCEVTQYKEEPAKEKVVKLEIVDDDEDSECGDHNDDKVESKDGKKVHVHKKKPTKTVEKLVTVGPFHIFRLRAIHKREVGISEWRNGYADLKADDSFASDEEEDDDHNEEETPG